MSRTYLVTGTNRGIGLELTRQLIDTGDHVIATARKPAEASVLKELNAEVVQLDVTSDDSIAALVATLGDRAIDTLINNAGVATWGRDITNIDLGDVRNTFEINVLGPIRVTQALLPNLKRGRAPVAAHMTSKMGSIEDNGSGGAYAYRISKAALNMFNKSLSLDSNTDGVTCVVLHPGWVQTDMGGTGAPLKPATSVSGLVKVLRGLEAADNGRFIDYEGQAVPW